jgi:hypothetical protein
VTAEHVAFGLAMKAARKLAEPATQDKLVKRLRAYKQAPKLNWLERGRLRRVIGDDVAANALMDQDEAGARALSALIAADVLREPESARSRAVADALIAEYPACIGADTEQARLIVYQLRIIRETQRAIGDQIGTVGDQIGAVDHTVTHVAESLSEVRRRLEVRDPAQLDPEVLLNGPLQGLELQPAYTEVSQLASDNPAAAATQLLVIINRIEARGYKRLARPFRRERAGLLARAGDFAAAADAWLPLVDDFLIAGFYYGVSDAVEAWREMATQDDAPTWLTSRADVVALLEEWPYGEFEAVRLMRTAIAAANAKDPAAPTWLALAAEACLVDKHAHSVVTARDRLLAAAAETNAALVAIRLTLAVADATGDESLWQQLLKDATPGSRKCSTEHAALIRARWARKLFWDGELSRAVDEFRSAADLGSRAHRWEDAVDWTESAREVLFQTGVINVAESDVLTQQEAALQGAGPGTLLEYAYAPDNLALTTLVQVDGPDDYAARTTRYQMRQYLHRSIVLGQLNNERAAHRLLGRLHLRVDDFPSAVSHFLAAGDAHEAGDAAAKLDRYYDTSTEAASPALDTRTAALRVASRQADLIPDDRVGQWARTALDEAKKRTATPRDPFPCVNAYDVLDGLAARLPDELVLELLDEIDGLLSRYADIDRPVDNQIARILIQLGRDNDGKHRRAVANCIATALEVADTDTIAELIADEARSLSSTLEMVRDRLRNLLRPGVARRRSQVLNAAQALAEIGDQCPELTAVADAIAAQWLEGGAGLQGFGDEDRLPGVEQSATIAGGLLIDRKVQLACHFADRVLDGKDDEQSRATCAAACAIMGADLPADVRNELFDKLFPLKSVTLEEVPGLFDTWEPLDIGGYIHIRKLRNLFKMLGIKRRPGELRRGVLKALAVLAADLDRQERLWRAAQQITISGDWADILAVTDVGYTLSKNGFAAHLPWDMMACSSDAETRRLAAALIPFIPKFDIELVSNLARDAAPGVRQGLATSLSKINVDNLSESDAEHVETVVATLRADPSYRVRREVSVADGATSH